MTAILNPSSQLAFNRPLTRSITKILSVTNPHEYPIAFKVKTTAPKLYVVRPNSGRVEPGESIEVSVILQALKEEPPAGAKCKDKFLIQTTSLYGHRESLQQTELWNPTDDAPENMVHQQKIRVAYLPVEGEAIPEDTEQPSMITSDGGDLSRFDTVREHPSTSNGHAQPELVAEAGSAPGPGLSPPSPVERAHSPGDFIVAQEETTTTHILHDMDEPVPVPAPVPVPVARQATPPPPRRAATPPQPIVETPPPPVVTPAAAPAPAPAAPVPQQVVAPAVDTAAVAALAAREREHDALMSRYEDALAEIARLQGELSTASAAAAQQPVGMRRRTTTRVVSEDGETVNDGASDDGTAVDTMMEKGQPMVEGVPVNVVAGIALAVFLATYLFF